MNIIALFAVEKEVVQIPNITTHITGVGKINAAYATTKIITDYSPDLILNIGTAGTINLGIGDVVVSNKFIDRDYFGKDIQTIPGSLEFKSDYFTYPPSIINRKESHKKYVINTGDCFLTDNYISSPGDVYDMESYAIASVCKNMGVEMLAIKAVTDIIGKNSLRVWENRLGYARLKLSEYLSKYIIPKFKNV